jgi:hypothetical protein
MKKILCAAVVSVALCSPVVAQDYDSTTTEGGSTTVQTQSYTYPVSPDVSVGGQSTTIYQQPNAGPNGPEMGTQRGSSANTSIGPTIKYTFP